VSQFGPRLAINDYAKLLKIFRRNVLEMERICMTEEVPEREARAFDTLQGTTIFITQRDGSFYAYQNLCPHLQTELEYLKTNF
jgi:hypothetical protein